MHTVVAADPNGVPIRVACGYCSSEHNYRGGPRMGPASAANGVDVVGAACESAQRPRAARADRQPFPVVSERERTAPPMSVLS